MRRLADLSIEKQFGIHGDGKLVEMPASQGSTQPTAAAAAAGGAPTGPPGGGEGGPGGDGPRAAAAAAGGTPPAPPGRVKGAQAAQLRAPTVSRIDARATRSRSRTAAP